MVTPARRASASRNRKAALAVLVVGAVVAVATGLVSTWPGRFGLVVAVAAGWVALTYAWREVNETRLSAHRDLMTNHQRAYESLVAERAGNDAVVGLLSERNEMMLATLTELRDELVARQAELAERRREVAALRGDNSALRHDVDRLVRRVDSLSNQIAVMESRVDPSLGEVLALPRRSIRHERTLWSDAEVLGTADVPTVVDLVRSDPASGGVVELRRQA